MSKRRDRFAIVPGWIFDCAEFTATETLVFACLCLFANDKKMCFPSVAELARVSKLGKSTVARTLNSLEKKRAIFRNNRYNAGGQTSNFYQLSEAPDLRGGRLPLRESETPDLGGEQHQLTIPNEQGGIKNTLSLMPREKTFERVAPLRDFEKLAKDMIIDIETGGFKW